MVINPIFQNQFSNNGFNSFPQYNSQYYTPGSLYGYDQFGPSALSNPYNLFRGNNQFGFNQSPFGQYGNQFSQYGSPFGQYGSQFGFNQSPFGQYGSQFGQYGSLFGNSGYNQNPYGTNGPFSNQLYNQALESMAFNQIASNYLTQRNNNPYGNTSWIGSNQRTDAFLAKNGIDPRFAYLYPRIYAQLDNALDRQFPGQVTQPNSQLSQLSQPFNNQFNNQFGQSNNQFTQPNQFNFTQPNQFAQSSQITQPNQFNFTQPNQFSQTNNQTALAVPPSSFRIINPNSFSFSQSPTSTVAFNITIRIFITPRSRVAA